MGAAHTEPTTEDASGQAVNRARLSPIAATLLQVLIRHQGWASRATDERNRGPRGGVRLLLHPAPNSILVLQWTLRLQSPPSAQNPLSSCRRGFVGTRSALGSREPRPPPDLGCASLSCAQDIRGVSVSLDAPCPSRPPSEHLSAPNRGTAPANYRHLVGLPSQASPPQTGALP